MFEAYENDDEDIFFWTTSIYKIDILNFCKSLVNDSISNKFTNKNIKFLDRLFELENKSSRDIFLLIENSGKEKD